MPAKLRTTRILIVQADPAWAGRVKDKLGRRGYAFAVAKNNREGLAHIKKKPFDVILVDAKASKAGCKGSCAEIENLAPGTPKIVLAMTGEEAMEAKSSCGVAQKYLAWNHTSKKLLTDTIRRSIDEHEQEISLRREADFNAAMFDTLGAIVVVFDLKGRFVRVNRAFQKVLGYSRAEVVGKSARLFLARKQDMELASRIFSDPKSKTLAKQTESLWKAKNGGKRLISWSHATLKNDDGTIRNIICTGVDITEQRQSEEMLRSVAEGVSGTMGETFFQSLATYLASALGTDYAFVGELVGKSNNKIRTLAVCAKGKRAENFEYDLAGTPCRKVMSRETCYYGKDVQRKFPKDVLLKDMGINAYLGTVLKDSAGCPMGILVVLKETPLETPEKIQSLLNIFAVRAATELERSRTEDALRESEERFSAFSKYSPHKIHIKDTQGRYILINPTSENLFGIKNEKARGKISSELFDKEMGDSFGSHDREVLKTGKAAEREEGFYTKDGERTFLTVKFPIRNAKGKIIAVGSSGTDITERTRTEEALRESEERFSKAFHVSPVLIAISSPRDGVHHHVNETWLKIMGYQRKEVIGKTAQELNTWVCPKARKQVLKDLKNGKGVRNFETQLRTKTGEAKDFLVSVEQIEIQGRKRLIWSANDITERKKTENALRESEELFESIFFGNPALAAISDLDDGRFYEVNQAWLAALGYKRHEVIGRTVYELDIWPEPEKRKLLTSRILKEGSVKGFEGKIRSKKGKVRDYLISGEKMVIADEPFALIIASDITDRKRTEAALRESEERFSKAFNANPSLVVIVDANSGEYYDVNQTFLSTMGFKRSEVIGKTPMDLNLWVHPDLRKNFINALKKKGFVHNFQKRLRTKKGEERDFLFSGEVMDIGGKSCFLLSGVDITERIQAEAALEKARDEMEMRVVERTHQLQEEIEQRKQTERSLLQAREEAETASLTKTRFLANMSHELRTPLNAILGFSGAMKEQVFGPLGDEKYEDYITNIMESGNHLLGLIEDILDLSKIEVGVLNLNEEELDVSRTVSVSLNFIRSFAENRGVELNNRVNGKMPLIKADPLRVKQVLINLLSNAVKFTPRGGKITVRAKEDKKGDLIISVSDTGIGMAEDDIPQALAEFGQLDSQLAKAGVGSGLGLPLSQRLMGLHGGSLGITSRVGEGTVVTVHFPKERVLS